jgi:hypothetical protein
MRFNFNGTKRKTGFHTGWNQVGTLEHRIKVRGFQSGSGADGTLKQLVYKEVGSKVPGDGPW